MSGHIAWRCAQCSHPHHTGMPDDGCKTCGWVDDFDWRGEQLAGWAS